MERESSAMQNSICKEKDVVEGEGDSLFDNQWFL